MLTFEQPLWLLLLAAAPLTAWRLLRRAPPALRFPSVESLGPARTDHARIWGAVGRGLVVALLAVAAAGPRLPDHKTRLPSEGVAIVLAVDVSGSMAAPDVQGVSRLEAAKAAFERFIRGRGGDAIALVTFAATPRTECPPTLNHEVLRTLLQSLEPRSGLDAGTNIGDAIAESLLRLRNVPVKRKAIILLSDGEHNAAGSGADAPLTPRQAAQLAANLEVPVYAIDCGNEADDDEARARRSAGQAILKASAEMTGGRAFPAHDMNELDRVLAEIDTLERAPILSFQYRRYRPLGWCLVIAALGVWAMLLLLEAYVWQCLP